MNSFVQQLLLLPFLGDRRSSTESEEGEI